MKVVFPDTSEPARWTFNRESALTDDEYFELCAANPDFDSNGRPKGKS